MSDRVCRVAKGWKAKGEEKNSKFDQPPPIVSIAETKRETFARANADAVHELKLR